MTGADGKREEYGQDPTELSGCEFCAFWAPTFCRRNNWGWPSVGTLCSEFVREPGVEG